LVYVGTPDKAGRELILGIHSRDMPLASDVDLGKIAADTERFTGADLEDVVRRAGLQALKRAGGNVQEVTAADFAAALEDSRATVTAAMEEEYKKMRGELKKRAAETGSSIGFIHEGMLESTREHKHRPAPVDLKEPK
jgi:transitional endoplasmic reticulum ATPase